MLGLGGVLLLSVACKENDEPAPVPSPPPSEDPFGITITEVTTVTAKVNVEPKDSEAGYFSNVLSDNDYQQMKQFGVDDYLQYFIEVIMESEGVDYATAVKVITTHGEGEYDAMDLEPGSLYHAIAVGIDAAGKSNTAVVEKEFSTNKVEASKNTFDVTVSEQDLTTVKVSIHVGNSDPYFVDIQPVGLRQELTEEPDFAKYMVDRYLEQGMLAGYLFYNDREFTVERLKPGWEYEVIVFGCNEGSVTTDAKFIPFQTLEGGSPADCTFEFDWELKALDKSDFYCLPSDENVVYMCDIITEEDYQMFLELGEGDADAGMSEFLDTMIDEYMEFLGTRTETIDLLADCGELGFQATVSAGKEYRMWAVSINQSGEPAASFEVSEPFLVPESEWSESATITIDDYAWYDGDALYELDPVAFAGARGNAVVAINVTHSPEAAHWYTGVFLGNLMESSDQSVIKNLTVWGLPDFKDQEEYLLIAYWGESTICAAAEDAEGNFGPIVRQLVNITKETASPVPSTFAAVKSLSQTKFRKEAGPVRPASIDRSARVQALLSR